MSVKLWEWTARNMLGDIVGHNYVEASTPALAFKQITDVLPDNAVRVELEQRCNEL